MWLADNWQDYEVIDASNGEKIERFGDYRLVRPDPQVIWDTPRDTNIWRKKNAHYHRSKNGGGEWEFFNLPEEWQILYPLFTSDSGKARLLDGIMPVANELTFNLKPFSFKHTGIFPEQAVNWDWMSEQIITYRYNNSNKSPKILNLFAYTGGATVAAASAGAFVTHVDSAKGMVSWAKENAHVSGIPEDRIRWITDDCSKFVAREIRRGHTYDAIIMDPPSYGRGPKGEIWKLEDNIYEFISLCGQLLSDSPLFVLVNSYTTGLQPGVLSYMLKETVQKRFGGRVTADEVGLPVTGSDKARRAGLVLPCGAAGRWEV